MCYYFVTGSQSCIQVLSCVQYLHVHVLLYASAHLGAYYCMDINIWYPGVYHMKEREHIVFFRNACKRQIVCMISILRHYNSNILTCRGRLQS